LAQPDAGRMTRACRSGTNGLESLFLRVVQSEQAHPQGDQRGSRDPRALGGPGRHLDLPRLEILPEPLACPGFFGYDPPKMEAEGLEGTESGAGTVRSAAADREGWT